MLGTELQRPLNPRELEQLSAFLTRSPGAMLLPQAHGFLSAIGSAPTMLMPSVWQGQVLGQPEFESMAEAQRVLGLVMRLYNQILTELNKGRAVVPPHADDSDALGLWCCGYLKAARLDDVWCDDEHGVALLFPIAVLAGEIELTGEQDSNGKVIEDPTAQLERCRAMLGPTTVDIHKYWPPPWRREHSAASVVQRGPEIGRNEKCPCGTGRPEVQEVLCAEVELMSLSARTLRERRINAC